MKKYIIISFILTLFITSNIYANEEYVVKKNDNLTKIAKLNNLSLENLLNYNPQILNTNRIYPKDIVYLENGLSPGLISGINSKEITNTSTNSKSNQNNNTITTTKKTSTTTNSTNTNSQDNAVSNGNINSYEQEVCNLVNKYRAENGLNSLTLATDVSKMAELKAEDMATNNYFDHTSPTYGDPFEMLKSLGIEYQSAGENIAKGQKTPAKVMNAWMNSAGHKANILDSTFTEIGVGYVLKSGTTYWTQEFISR